MGEAPQPKSPPRYPDLCGRRRLQLEVQILNREVGFLEQEIRGLERIQPVSRCCKDVNEFVSAKTDPMIPVSKRKHGSCSFSRWIRSKLRTCFSCLCCFSCSCCTCRATQCCTPPTCSCPKTPSCSSCCCSPGWCSCSLPSCSCTGCGHCRTQCGNCCPSGCSCADCPCSCSCPSCVSCCPGCFSCGCVCSCSRCKGGCCHCPSCGNNPCCAGGCLC